MKRIIHLLSKLACLQKQTNQSLLKKILLIIFSITFFTNFSYSQTIFQKITTGRIVNDTDYCQRCAWGDYDNDGFLDLVVSAYNDNNQAYDYPLEIYHNNGDGTFLKVTSGAIANYTGRSYGVAWGDYDNDGKLDLYICSGWNGNNALFHNEGNGNFTRITDGEIVNDGGWSVCCNWVDYDKDGWLDLFVGNAYNQKNFLYHNNGNGTFTKITVGAIVNDLAWSRGSAWGDYDNDGWPDLFVVNYQGLNDFLYHNNGNGTFTRILNGPEVNEGLWGSACNWIDYDNDGKLDLFVTNNNQGAKLYHNDGNGNFSLYNSLPSNNGGNGLDASWCDYDNDGFLDLFVCNFSGGNFLYHNNGIGGFTRVSNEIVTNDYSTSIGCTWGDYNNDGKIDLFVANAGSIAAKNFLYQNIGAPGNYLICKLHGCMPLTGNSNKSGIGARIKLYSGNLFEMRDVTAGSGIGSENMLWQQFGLGTRTNIDSLVVFWPSGKIQKINNLTVNHSISIDECLIGIENNHIPVKFELKQNYPNPFNPNTTIEYSLMKYTQVRLSVIDITGKVIEYLVNQFQYSGEYKYVFDGTKYSSGVYFYKLETQEFSGLNRMVLIK